MMRLASIGEIMLELSEANSEQFHLGFAGDTYNVAVYCRRCSDPGHLQVDYVTALGDDPLSTKTLQAIEREHIGVSNITVAPGRQVGLYIIQTDHKGERKFYYYRSEAPVRDLFSEEAGDNLIENLLHYDALYLSGITLAVLHTESRDKLFQLLDEARARGKKIIFDNNFRLRLWKDIVTARSVYSRVYEYVSIALPSFEDAQALFDDKSSEAAAARLIESGVDEVVVKCGQDGFLVADRSKHHFSPVKLVENVVDTTSAGDSFNGGYLAKRLTGASMQEAAEFASQLAAIVIQHRGAIIDVSHLKVLLGR